MTDQIARSVRKNTKESLDVARLLDIALHMANRADEVALSGFGGNTAYETKGDGSPVTRVDREIESLLRDTIDREHPQAGILGEEYGEERGIGRWVLDPIDGTREFISGDPRFAILLAYELDDEAVVGLVSAPALGMRWWAGAGLGASVAYRGEVTPAEVSAVRRLDRSSAMWLGGVDSAAPMHRVTRRAVSWEAVRVAAGEHDLAVTAGYRWDVAPIPVIVREAGGWARMNETGDDLFRLVVSNSHLAHEASRLV